MTADQAQTVNLAIGRIFRMGNRPEQSGDTAEYFRCRALILDIVEGTEFDRKDMSPDYSRDRLKGAAGDF